MSPILIKGIISIKSAGVITVTLVMRTLSWLYYTVSQGLILRIFFSLKIMIIQFHADQNRIGVKYKFYSEIPKNCP